ncbi:hypothetical protein [Enterococcus sp. N249-2]
MAISNITKKWVLDNKNVVIGDIYLGYKKDRYTDQNIDDVMRKFDYNVSPYFIGRSLFQEIRKIVKPKLRSINSKQRIENEISQIVKFCRLGEYGQNFLDENSFDDLIEEWLE